MGMSLVDQVRAVGNPIVDGQTATFVWRGKSAPVLDGDFTSWDPAHAIELEPAGRGVWVHRHKFAPATYMEYAFAREGTRQLDPFNPQVSWNGIAGYNHYFYMPGGEPTELITLAPGVARGTVTQHVLPRMWGEDPHPRVVQLYRPAARKPVPLLVVYDGRDFFRRVKLTTIVDNLIAERRIRPLAIAFVPTFRPTRWAEYACSDVTLGFVLDEVLPLAKAELDLVSLRSHPGAFGVLGASMGGLMALYTGIRRPDIFGRVLGQSTALSNGSLEYVVWDLIRGGAKLPRLWLSPGQYELPGILPANRRLRDLLRTREATFEYREAASGHNFPSWRDDVWRGLEWLFPVS